MDFRRRVIGLSFFLFIMHCCSGAKYFIAAPNLLRVGVEETVSITIFDTNNEVTVKLQLQDFPHKKKTFSQVEGKFKADQPGILKVKVNMGDLSDQKSLGKQYVYLKASSASPGLNFNREMKVLVGYRNAMVFIQTDKPIYNPGQTVYLRAIPLDLDLMPSIKDFTIEILNPQGIRVNRWSNLNANDGFFTKNKELSDNALPGNWTAIALYGHGLVQNTSIQFEVKEYILPKFSVEIEGPPYVLEDDKEIGVKVTSKYTYGKSVVGTAQITLAVLNDAGKGDTFSTTWIKLNNGQAKLVADTKLLKNHKKKLWFPDGKRLLIEAKVTEKATGKQEHSTRANIYFTNSPLKISFKRTPKYFKPGVPYGIKVDVSYLNGKPAGNIVVEFVAKTNDGKVLSKYAKGGVKDNANTDTTDKLGHAGSVVDVPADNQIKFLDIKVNAKIQDRGKVIVSKNVFQPTMYSSPGRNYLFLRIPKSKVGDMVNAEAFILTKGNPTSLTYLVVAHGKVVFQGKITSNLGVLKTITFRVTPQMSPQARFTAFYWVNNELVADSTIMEVEEHFPNPVTFETHKDTVSPGNNYDKIKVQTNPLSNVGFLAVDQSVYLLRNDKHLTFDEVFKRIRSHDLGCGAGAGRNNKDVLANAGLAVMSDINNLQTDTRADQSCSAASRRKRSLVGFNPTCCKLGEVRDSKRSCFTRAQEFAKSDSSALYQPRDECVVSFYRCCWKKFEKDPRARQGADVAIPPDLFNNEIDEEMLDSLQLRTHFPESWLFENHKAGKDGKVSLRVTVPDTITTWVIQAVSVSKTTGFGLAAPFHLTSFKEFFVSLSLPYSVQRGEQVSVVATVYNYNSKLGVKMKVFLSLVRPPFKEFCTYIDTDKKTPIYSFEIEPASAKSVSFPIVPTIIGDVPITVRAYTAFGGDQVQRVLNVVPEGMERTKTLSVILDPQGFLQDPAAPSGIKTSAKGTGVQRNKFSLILPDSAVPESESAQLSVIGNLIGPVVANIIEGRGLGSIIRLPSGCGEQTMLSLAPNVFVFQYLRSTKQVTNQIETTAFKFIRSGYRRELNYRRRDNSFSAFGESRAGSTWLTAFVAKTFCAIQKLGGVDVDQNVISSAIQWLLSIQRADGAIPERQPVIHQEMNGDINGVIAMTAYVVTAMYECNTFQDSTKTLQAVRYLENNRNKIKRVYVKAVVAYALALASSPQKDSANNELIAAAHYDATKNVRYWTDGGNAINVETTSYVLLTQLELQRLGYSGPIVVWLTEQRKGGGGFVSTQDTCVALQALAAYSQAAAQGSLNLKITITSAAVDNYKRTILIDKKNALVQQSLDIKELYGGEVVINTEGSGVAQLQVDMKYNTPATEKEVCQFDLKVNTNEEVNKLLDLPRAVAGENKNKSSGKGKARKGNKGRRRRGRKCKSRGRGRGRRRGRRRRCGRGGRRRPKPTARPTRPPPNNPIPVPNKISITVCVKYKKAGETAGMSIIDVGILTGFSAIKESLDELKDKVKPGIARYEISDRHIVLYLDKIPSTHDLCYTLEMRRNFDVGVIQPVPVQVYDYYEPDIKCIKYYGPKPNSPLKLASCKQDSCKCALDKCTDCNPSNKVDDVVNKLCSVYDYAFKGEVRSLDENRDWLRIKIDVKEVISRGKSGILKKGKQLIFVKQPSCICPKISADTTYLIMGYDRGFRGNKVTMNHEVFAKLWPKINDKFFRDFERKLSGQNLCSPV